MNATLMQGAVDGVGQARTFVRVDSSGRLNVGGIDSTRPLYSSSVIGLAVAAAATDIYWLPGSATKTVRVWRVTVSGIATAAGAYALALIKRSTADTAGTSSAATGIPMDANSAAGTSLPLAYTANPTTGSTVGTVGVRRLIVTTAAAAVAPVPVVFDFMGVPGLLPVVLRGVAQGLAINLQAATMAGGALDIEVLYSEE